MCGIVGCYYLSPHPMGEILPSLRNMVKSLSHRGPDGEGIWVSEDGRTALGHRRLAIIDLSPTGAQPMSLAGGQLVITFNGEIYNYLELRQQLATEGVLIHGNSDTEVAGAAICRWGAKHALNQFVGMFAFGVWDKTTGNLLLARDRAGKKPLYYYHDKNIFIFGSEIKAIKCRKDLSLTINQEALSHYLSLGYVPSPFTIYNEIQEVPPGHYLEVSADLSVKLASYWRYPTRLGVVLDFQEAVDEVERLLTDAVTLRLRADVPVGAFLSGGLDSGLITAIAATHSSKQITTFTVGFNNSAVDERPLARLVAERYRTDHREILLTPNLDDILPKIVNAYDEPFADPSAVPTFAVAQQAGSELKVVLNGEGSDEILAGYRRYMAVNYLRKISPYTSLFPNSFYDGLKKILPLPTSSRTPYAFFFRFLRGLTESSFERYVTWGSDGFTETEKASLLKKDVQLSSNTPLYLEKSFQWLNNEDPFKHFMAMDFVSMMTDCLLVKMDIATMAHSLEARCPFLDHRLVEFCARLPAKVLLPGKTSKPILRQLAKKYLPAALVTAPKRGFEIPLTRWMREDLREITRDACSRSNGLISQYFNKQSINNLLDGPKGMDEERWAKKMWILMMLGLWDNRS